MITPLGWVERVPTYKEQRENIHDKDLGTYGFVGYPLLQSADILICQAVYVPVGEDQVAHIELTREVSRRFNEFYTLGKVSQRLVRTEELTAKDRQYLVGESREIIPGADNVFHEGAQHPEFRKLFVFPEPQPLLTPSPKLPGTDGRKMSKSYGNTVLLTDPEPVVRQKLKPMVTDPARVRRTDPGNPDVCPVGDLHKIFSSKETMAKVYDGCRSAGIASIECKSCAADAIVAKLAPMQERRQKYERNPRLAWDILDAGSAKAQKAAEATMQEARAAMYMSKEFESGTEAKSKSNS